MILIFNALGLAFVGIGLAAAVLFSRLTGYTEEGPWMVMGPVVAAADLAYRLPHRDGHWFSPRGSSSYPRGCSESCGWRSASPTRFAPDAASGRDAAFTPVFGAGLVLT